MSDNVATSKTDLKKYVEEPAENNNKRKAEEELQDANTCCICLHDAAVDPPVTTPIKKGQRRKRAVVNRRENASTSNADNDALPGTPTDPPKETEIVPLIPLECNKCNADRTRQVHQNCLDKWYIGNLTNARCPRCQTHKTLSKVEINDIRLRRGMPVEKTVR